MDICFYNFMGSSQIQFAQDFCTSVKYGTVGITVFRRKNRHSFMAQMSKENFDNSIAVELEDQGKYVVGKGNCMRFFNRDTFTPV